ncbi:MAG: DUF2341 domain-containing protein [Patescibacteria group bacterium]|nr:DUF2341 domain-containing protein [Patescibacteria group bacterium]
MQRGLSAHAKAGKARPLFFGIQPRKKRTKNIRPSFVISPLLAKVLIIAFYLFAIGGFVVVLNKTLHATGTDNIATVDFYANASQVEGAGNSWVGVDRVLGAPQITEAGAAADFSADNSVIYSGGQQALICDNFTTQDFIKNYAPIIEHPASTTQPVLENNNPDSAAAAAEQNISPAGLQSSSSPESIIASSTLENSSSPAADSPAADPAAQISSPPISDNSLPAQPEPPVAPALDNSAPTESAATVAPDTNTDSSAAPANETPAVETPNHLPDSQPVQEPAVQPAENSSPAADSAGPVSWLKELKNIFAAGKKEIGQTLLGKLAMAETQWGSAADDRNILFGPFKSAKIKISLAAIAQDIRKNKVSTSTIKAIASSTIENNATVQPMADSGSIASSSENSGSAAGAIMQKILDFFAPTGAGAEENSAATSAPIVIWYSFADEGGGNVWRELGKIDASSLSNADRGGYLSFDAPFLNDWRDLDKLRLKFQGTEPDGGNFSAYLDSVWVEISYQNGSAKPEEKPKITDKDKLNIDGREINFSWTDENSNENLIIKSDKKNYFGLTNAEMYFSVENTGLRDEQMNFQFYFPATSSSVVKMDQLIPNSPYLTEVPKYEAQIYDCANGWDKRENIWSCYPSEEQRACDEVSPNRRYCRINGVMTGTVEKIQYADRWQEVALGGQAIAPRENLLQKILGLGPQLKKVPDNFTNKKTTAEGVTIAPGQVKYFKAVIGFQPNSEGEFYIEAVGNNDGYGLLDPWWNSGWNYRLPITIDNTGNAGTLADHQLYLEISSSTSRDFWRNIKADGSDIRFTNSSQTTELPYWIQSFDYAASSTKIWIKVDSIPAATTSKIYLYYGNSGASSASDQFAPFTYSSLQNIFYTASSSAVKTINVVSLIDSNQVQLDSGTVINLNRQQTAVFTGFNSNSVIKAKGPLMAKLSGGAALESALPISFTGTSFVIPSFRHAENFNVYAPFADATTTIYDGATLKQTHSVAAGSAWMATQDIATDSIAIVEATKPVLFSFANSGPGDSLLGYPAGNSDLYGVKSRYNLIGAGSASSFSIYCSNNSSTTISSLARGAMQTNQICTGEVKGAGNAVRLGNISGAINAIQQDEGTSTESTMFLPFKEFSAEYMLPTNAAHIAVVCAPESGTVELSVYDQNNNFVSSSTCLGVGNYPGKAYFGAADATTYLAGSRIISTNGKPFYAYYEDTSAAGGGAETNLFGAVQTRNYSYPDPTFAFGAQQIEGPPTGIINSAAEKSDRSGKINVSIAINDLSRDNCRAKIEYVAQSGGHCDFGSPLAPLLDETFVSADLGLPVIANKNIYQIGTSTGWIDTASGTNNILFDWLSKTDLPAGDGTYCLRLTANDNISDQTAPATTTVVIDNAAPTVPGNLTLSSKTGASVTLKFAATSTDSHFRQYKIYYKLYDGAPVTEAGNLFGSSSDANLASANFNRATTTTINGLTAGLKYTFNLFAYDAFGNRSSSTAGIDVIANDPPTASFNSAAEKTDGSGRVDISFTADDANDDNTLRAKLEYQAGSLCDFTSASLATIDANNLTATFGTVQRDNSETYRIGTSSYYILTSTGENTINFDWLSATDVPAASSTYCLRLTANDGVDDQIVSSTIVVVLDNVKPSVSGNLTVGSSTETSLQLLLPITHFAQDSNEPAANAYKIFYKAGTSGVTTGDTQFVNSALNAYDFNGSSSVIVSGLSADTHYVFNIWAYDSFGNTAMATEVTAKTDADLTNKSLQFVNPESTGTTTNIAVADNSSAWNFRAKIADVDGYAALTDVTLRLADSLDYSSPFDDLKFTWTRSTGVFAETGADANGAAAVSPQSTSTCAADLCTVDFKIIFANSFTTSSVNYSGELYSTDASLRTAEDSYSNIFQIRKSWLDQQHYRWRNDNGGG